MGIDAEMFVRTRQPLTPEQVRILAFRLGETFGADSFYRDRENMRHHLVVVDRYEQDGPDLLPEPGEQFLRVHLWTRYYGVGYERGDLPFIVALAAWLETNIPGGEVWYGGDSSGVCAKPFGQRQRNALFRHFARQGHEPYAGSFDRSLGRGDRPVCGLCRQPMRQTMFSAGTDGGYTCVGCGHEMERRGGVLQEPSKQGGR